MIDLRVIFNMKSLFINLKNLLPYILLVAIYFFFVNIEARNDQNRNQQRSKNIDNSKVNEVLKSGINQNNKRIAIPVIPYKP